MCVAEEERAIARLEMDIRDLEVLMDKQRKEMGGYDL